MQKKKKKRCKFWKTAPKILSSTPHNLQIISRWERDRIWFSAGRTGLHRQAWELQPAISFGSPLTASTVPCTKGPTPSHHIPAVVWAGGREPGGIMGLLCFSQVGQKPADSSTDVCLQLILCAHLLSLRSTRAPMKEAITQDTTRQAPKSYSNRHHRQSDVISFKKTCL